MSSVLSVIFLLDSHARRFLQFIETFGEIFLSGKKVQNYINMVISEYCEEKYRINEEELLI